MVRLSIALLLLAPALVGSAQEHWSLRPIPEHEVELTSGEIDRYIMSRLSDSGIEPMSQAPAEILVRRVYYNLIGLPPSPDEIDRFVARMNEPEAFSHLVDRLLESKRFGEKWARHWLDLARFAESNGKDRDVVFPEAWRYRDYVIESFNTNKPYNEFVKEQIAGDLLSERSDNHLIATGFLALGPKAFQEPNNERFAMDVVDEQIDVLTRSFLGLTIACARCHDHKYDPISTEDYYALAGILLSSDTRYGPGPLYFARHDKDTELVPIGDRITELDPVVKRWRNEILALTEKVTGLRSDAYRIQRNIAGELRERGLKEAKEADDLAADEKRMLAMRAEADNANERRLKMIRQPPQERPGYAMAVLRSDRDPEDCAVRYGGVFNDHGQRVRRGSMAIPGLPEFGHVSESDSGRMQLANWIASHDNPLTARVFVNRVWHHLFGTGLVRSVDNFGVTGETPSHPQLLDHLARQFIADDWNVKQLIRRIVLSQTWQRSSLWNQSSALIDPENRLLWRANYRRLDVEAFRDSVLHVSGCLNLEPRRGSLLQDVYAGTDYGEPNDHRVNFDEEIARDVHRTIYLPAIRNRMPEFLRLFDVADPNVTSGSRNTRTIPSHNRCSF